MSNSRHQLFAAFPIVFSSLSMFARSRQALSAASVQNSAQSLEDFLNENIIGLQKSNY
jgi:hypothetical protein